LYFYIITHTPSFPSYVSKIGAGNLPLFLRRGEVEEWVGWIGGRRGWGGKRGGKGFGDRKYGW
jgi:hypothetical protein